MVSHGFYFLFNLSDKAQYLAGLLTGSECCRIVAVASVGILCTADYACTLERGYARRGKGGDLRTVGKCHGRYILGKLYSGVSGIAA